MDFAPGDVVVCVDDSMSAAGISLGLVRGSCYAVARFDPEPDNLGEAGVDVVECPCPKDSIEGFSNDYRASRFRRVYRPDGKFISKCLEPVDLGTEVEA